MIQYWRIPFMAKSNSISLQGYGTAGSRATIGTWWFILLLLTIESFSTNFRNKRSNNSTNTRRDSFSLLQRWSGRGTCSAWLRSSWHCRRSFGAWLRSNWQSLIVPSGANRNLCCQNVNLIKPSCLETSDGCFCICRGIAQMRNEFNNLRNAQPWKTKAK